MAKTQGEGGGMSRPRKGGLVGDNKASKGRSTVVNKTVGKAPKIKREAASMKAANKTVYKKVPRQAMPGPPTRPGLAPPPVPPGGLKGTPRRVSKTNRPPAPKPR